MRVVTAMQKLWRETGERGAETAHEQAFVRRFGGRIAKVLSLLTTPNLSWEEYTAEKACAPFNLLLEDLRKVVRSNLSLHLEHISPVLARKANTGIAMPGLSFTGDDADVLIYDLLHFCFYLMTKVIEFT